MLVTGTLAMPVDTGLQESSTGLQRVKYWTTRAKYPRQSLWTLDYKSQVLDYKESSTQLQESSIHRVTPVLVQDVSHTTRRGGMGQTCVYHSHPFKDRIHPHLFNSCVNSTTGTLAMPVDTGLQESGT